LVKSGDGVVKGLDGANIRAQSSVPHPLQQSRTGDLLMSESFPLPTEPEGVIPSLVERFNSGKVEVMMALYAPEAVFIANDGRTIRDRTEITAQFQRDMSLGLPLKANVRHVFVGDDTAQIVVDWSIDGKGPDGKNVHLGGSASDIVRRGVDGRWRYIIDNNQGTAVRQAA
jgi:ketosteroid isomerase-like protein